MEMGYFLAEIVERKIAAIINATEKVHLMFDWWATNGVHHAALF